MYAHVINETEQELFKNTFLKVTEKYEFKYNEMQGVEERFLLLKRHATPLVVGTPEYLAFLNQNTIGTLEVNPFVPGGHSIVQEYIDIDLSVHPGIIGREHETWEIGKLCILEKYQSRGFFRNLFLVIYDHSERTSTVQYVGSMVIPLFKLFRSQFSDAIQQIGPPDNDKTPGIPVLINADKMKQNKNIIRLLERYMQQTV